MLYVDQARAASIEPVDDDDSLQGRARRSDAKGGDHHHGEQRTYFNKHAFLPDFIVISLDLVRNEPASQGKVPLNRTKLAEPERQARDWRRVAGSRIASLAALRALAVIVAVSGLPGGTSQLPPTHGT